MAKTNKNKVKAKLTPQVQKKVEDAKQEKAMKGILPLPIKELMDTSMGNYGTNINLFRGFADVRDGFKPVQRRVAHAAFTMSGGGLKPSGPYRKVAGVVGKVIAETHPHGDASIVDALVKMAQWFYMSYGIIDGHGNFGAISGDEASAMRYIECKMSKYGWELLEGIDKNAVDWKPNFDNTQDEPSSVPAKYPNILLNGSFGMGHGYAAAIPPGNFGEVVDATIKVIKKADISLDEVAEMFAPDYPTGGTIVNKSALKEMYKNGEGTVKLRGKVVPETNLKTGKPTNSGNIMITEIPYLTTVGAIVDKIQEKAKEGAFEGVADVVDETNEKNGIRVVIKLKRGVDPSVIENQLYQLTPLENGLYFSLICVNGLTFKRYDILSMIREWVDYRRTTLKRIFNYDIAKLRRRIHIIEGLLKALADIDKVIKIIKGSSDKSDAQKNLITKYKLTEIQSEAIVEIPLHRLSKIGADDLRNERDSKDEELKGLTQYFSDPEKLDAYIIAELEEGKKKYGRKRRTELADIDTGDKEAVIANTNHTIFLTKEGFVKKLSLEMGSQGTGGKGRNIGKMKEGDYIISAFNANNRDNLLCFTDKGRVLVIKVYELKDTNLLTYGYLLNTYVNLQRDEKVVSVLTLDNEQYKNDNAYLIFVTEKGLIKRSSLSHYNSVPKSGLIACKINDGDSIVDVRFADTDYDVLIATEKGLGIRFNTEEVTLTLRMSIGMKALGMDADDKIVSFAILDDPSKTHVLVVSSGGTGKRIEMSAFSPQARASKAKIVTKLAGESLVKILPVRDEDEITIVGEKKMIKLRAEDVPVLIRSSSPKKIMSLDKGDKVVDASVE